MAHLHLRPAANRVDESSAPPLDRPRREAPHVLLILLALLGIGAACSGSDGGDGPTMVTGATILRFQAEPTSIFPGERSTLRWEVRDAATIGIQAEGGAAVEIDEGAMEAGAVQVAPEATTSYELVAIGRDGRAVTRTATVTLRPAKPEVLSFTVSPEEIEVGDGASLSWATAGATSIRIIEKGRGELDVRGASPEDGSLQIRPAASTTYTLEASNTSGQASATVEIRVVDPLDLEFYAHQPSIVWGETTLLDWRTRSAHRVVLSAGDQVLVDSSASSGKWEVQPERTTTYRFVAHGQSGTKELTAEVRVEAGIDTFEAAVTEALPRGLPIELSWTTRGAETLAITAADGLLHQIEGADRSAGSVILPIPNDGSFVLTATTVDGLETQRELRLPLLDGAEVLELSASPESLTLDHGSTAEIQLRWRTHLATSVEVVRVGAGVVHASDVTEQEGGATVLVDRTSTFVFTARNAAGSDSSQVEVQVVLPPRVEAFEARPTHVGVGETFLLEWDAPDSTSVELFQGPSRIHRATGSQGSFPYQIAVDSSFRLVATNSLGQTAEASLNVSVGAPEVVSFEVSSDRVGPRSQIGFSWTNLGGTSLQIVGPSGPIASCATAEIARVRSGSCNTTAPEAQGSYPYELVLTNDIEQSARSLRTVTVADGPTIVSFTVDRSLISLGDPLTFYWETLTDAGGVVPSLTLRDGDDSYPLAGADPLQGSITLTPLRTGERTFELVAATEGTASASWELEVSIFALPSLIVSASSETYFPGEGPVELSWTSEDAIGISIEELGDDGAVELGYFAEPSLVAQGSFGVLPPAPGRTYRILALNAAGASVPREVSVSWHQPRILDFIGAPPDIQIGDLASLLWETIRSDRVSISPRPMISSGAYTDVSANPSATSVELGPCGSASVITDGCAPISLPVPFPFGGSSHQSAKVFLNGVLSFDLSYEGPSSTPVEFPSPSSFAHLAPFWQDLAASVPDGGDRMGTIYVDRGSDDLGDYSVVQWSGFWVQGASSSQPVDLNFQIVLYATGGFDFRYGRMEGVGAHAGAASGERASIGYQDPAGAEAQSISFRREVGVGLGDRSLGLRFDELPTSGTLEILPLHEGANEFSLVASSTTGTDTASTGVTTHAGVVLLDIAASTEYPAPSQGFEISWVAPGAEVVQVERPKVDEEDPNEEAVVLCSFTGSGPGSCTVTESSQGAYRYVVRAIGPGVRNEALGEIELLVFPPFSIDTFSAIAFVEAGETEEDEDEVLVEIRWTTTNVDTIELAEAGVVLDTSGLSVSEGSLIRPYSPGLIYTLEVQSAGRTRSESTTVVDPPPPPEPPGE